MTQSAEVITQEALEVKNRNVFKYFVDALMDKYAISARELNLEVVRLKGQDNFYHKILVRGIMPVELRAVAHLFRIEARLLCLEDRSQKELILRSAQRAISEKYVHRQIRLVATEVPRKRTRLLSDHRFNSLPESVPLLHTDDNMYWMLTSVWVDGDSLDLQSVHASGARSVLYRSLEKIKERQGQGFSWAELARAVGGSHNLFSMMKVGKMAVSSKLVWKLGKLLKVPQSELFSAR